MASFLNVPGSLHRISCGCSSGAVCRVTAHIGRDSASAIFAGNESGISCECGTRVLWTESFPLLGPLKGIQKGTLWVLF